MRKGSQGKTNTMRVITFSRTYPANHPKRGEPTHFVEKIWKYLYDLPGMSWDVGEYQQRHDNHFGPEQVISVHDFTPKLHTIRAGNRWKAGDMFSPRVWSGRPYNSKQIEFAPPMEVKRVWGFEIDRSDYRLDGKKLGPELLRVIAGNDGLSIDDFECWFRWPKEFSGQIISWSENLNY